MKACASLAVAVALAAGAQRGRAQTPAPAKPDSLTAIRYRFRLLGVYDAQTGDLQVKFFAYGTAFKGGVRVAIGDINGDGIPDRKSVV